jgi:hypothetical protein
MTQACYVWKATLETTHQTSVWWDWHRPDADAVIALYTQDAERISKRDKSIAIVEQRLYAFPDKTSSRGAKPACDILNNTWPSKIELKIRFDCGEIVAFERSQKKNADRTEMLPLEIGDPPTLQYAQAYAEMLQNPALYLLCARAPTANSWISAAQRACWDVPKHILRWLYRKVKQGD